jgi:hypothetical protein
VYARNTLCGCDIDIKKLAVRYHGDDSKREIWRTEEDGSAFVMIRSNILHCERVLLHVLNFDFHVQLPQHFIIKYVQIKVLLSCPD